MVQAPDKVKNDNFKEVLPTLNHYATLRAWAWKLGILSLCDPTANKTLADPPKWLTSGRS